MAKIQSVCVYCGSSPGNDRQFVHAASELGASIAGAGLRLVYGGGTRGLMGAVADGAMSAGGHVTGIIPQFLMEKEATAEALSALNELIVTDDMHERKHALFERSDAFITLPGGIGTLEEVIEVLTWAQLGRHTKPIILANFNRFWDPLTDMLDHMAASGFIHTAHKVKPVVIDAVDDIVSALIAQASNDHGDTGIISKL